MNKILIINSQPIFKSRNNFFINKNTGEFLQEIINNGYKVILFQTVIETSNENYLNNYLIDLTKIQLFLVTRSKHKLITYLRVLLKSITLIRLSDHLYIFYPTNIFYRFIALLFKVNGKYFGLYLRGQKGFHSFFTKLFFRQANFICTVSPFFTNKLNEIGVKAFTIKPMIDYDKDDILKEKKAPKKKVNFLFVGRVERDKGVFEIVEAALDLVKYGLTNYKIRIVGNGIDSKKINNAIIENNLVDFVEYVGEINEKDRLKSFYTLSDVFIFPSYHEGFPRVLYEAMIFGLPIITTFVGGIPGIMVDHYNCYKIEKKDSNDLAVKMKYFITGQATYDKLSEHGRLTINKYLTDNTDSHAKLVSEEFNNIS